jgi:hypothetical protein
LLAGFFEKIRTIQPEGAHQLQAEGLQLLEDFHSILEPNRIHQLAHSQEEEKIQSIHPLFQQVVHLLLLAVERLKIWGERSDHRSCWIDIQFLGSSFVAY